MLIFAVSMVILGQRKYGGPPPNWEGHPPGNGCEVFCGKIPKEMYEDELIPLFEKCGPIWDLRLMMDPMTGTNRGYAFVTFTNRDSALNAVKEVKSTAYIFLTFFLVCPRSIFRTFCTIPVVISVLFQCPLFYPSPFKKSVAISNFFLLSWYTMVILTYHNSSLILRFPILFIKIVGNML